MQDKIQLQGAKTVGQSIQSSGHPVCQSAGQIQDKDNRTSKFSLPVGQSKKILRINAKCKIVQSTSHLVSQSASQDKNKIKKQSFDQKQLIFMVLL